MDLGLQGKIAVVAGGSTGIGRETALTLAREGCRVAVCSRSRDKLDSAVEAFAQEGFPLFAMSADMTSEASAAAFRDAVVAEFGRIDIWVNCTGGNIRKPLWEITESDFDYIIGVNLKSCFIGCKTAGAQMKEQNGGVIVNIASAAAVLPMPTRALYATAKIGVAQFTKAAAGEYAAWNIRVNAIGPGTVMTELAAGVIPPEGQREPLYRDLLQKRVGDPWEIAKPVACIASNAFQFMTGETIFIDGGYNKMIDTDFSFSMKEQA